MTREIVIASFYKFVPVENPQAFQPQLKQTMIDYDVMGTVLLADEGVNGTVSGTQDHIDAFFDYLHTRPEFSDIGYTRTVSTAHPFNKVKVKLRTEIITLGKKGANPLEKRGTYVSPQEWNNLINQSDVVVIDTRNDYETHVGSFKGAVDPKVKTFKQLPEFLDTKLDPEKHKKVAMFCTGGIRCEKSTAYLLEQGFEEVYHLKGGILKYLEEIPKEESLWEGDCYVFDERITIDHDLQPTHNQKYCPNCGFKLSTKHRCHPDHQPGVRCIKCPNATSGEHAGK